MEQALELPSNVPETAVMTVSPTESSFSSERLAVLRSPTYAAFLNAGKPVGETGSQSIDLKALADREGVEAARRKVADVISTQLAHVLHLREEDINQARPLGEIGLDSLMALELVMNLEECFGIKIPLSGSSGALTIADMAGEIIAHVGLGRDGEDAAVATIAEQHHGALDPTQRETLKEMMTEEARSSKRLLS
jgi:acyl carrier protein